LKTTVTYTTRLALCLSCSSTMFPSSLSIQDNHGSFCLRKILVSLRNLTKKAIYTCFHQLPRGSNVGMSFIISRLDLNVDYAIYLFLFVSCICRTWLYTCVSNKLMFIMILCSLVEKFNSEIGWHLEPLVLRASPVVYWLS